MIRLLIVIGILLCSSNISTARDLVKKSALVVHVEPHRCLQLVANTPSIPTDCPFVAAGDAYGVSYVYLVLQIDGRFYGFTLSDQREGANGQYSNNLPVYDWRLRPYGRFVSSLLGAKATNTAIEVVLDEQSFKVLSNGPMADGTGANTSIRQITVGSLVQKLTICWMPVAGTTKCSWYDEPDIPSQY